MWTRMGGTHGADSAEASLSCDDGEAGLDKGIERVGSVASWMMAESKGFASMIERKAKMGWAACSISSRLPGYGFRCEW